jgi:hypothetical protein
MIPYSSCTQGQRGVTLEDILMTSELPAADPGADYGLRTVFWSLACEMAVNPCNPDPCREDRDLCRAGTAGISVLED